MESKFRQLSEAEVKKLIKQGCSCDDFSKIRVAKKFDPANVRSTTFSGNVTLGVFDGQVRFFGGVKKPSGISNATIHNCTIGDNVYIDQIRNYIANYVIEKDVVIENVDLLAVEGVSSFGNGTEVAVINENGGRKICIYDKLSAQAAYVMTFYRHRPKVIEKLFQMVRAYTETVSSSKGLLCEGARLINCRSIKNVKVGAYATVEGVDRLENGTVNSCQEDPVYIGPSVIAENFIVCSGSKVTDGTLISECFIGQGCELSKQYSAEHSLFFANCGGSHGEASSIFAGPFTVTYHKSTLLIAGLFSFLNAGSGSNQSNHMYKLGPVHQGIVQRGSKTGSGSYILWPAKIGAFTVVTGRHYSNPDTSDFPFSYLIEREGESFLMPGVNLRSVGTVRDGRKWPKRDRRKDSEKLDYINFNILSPFTIQKMLKGCELLVNLKAGTGSDKPDSYEYNRFRVNSESLEKGIEIYQIGIDKFLGGCLVKRLQGKKFETIDELRAALLPERTEGIGDWVDMAGLFAPEKVVGKLLDDIEAERISTLDEVAEAFGAMYEGYQEYEWSWAAGLLQQRLGRSIDSISAEDIIGMTKIWKLSVVKLDKLLYSDAKKEFTDNVKIGYGLDGNEKIKQGDFEAVRGKLGENSFISDIEEHTISKIALGDELVERMEKLRSTETEFSSMRSIGENES